MNKVLLSSRLLRLAASTAILVVAALSIAACTAVGDPSHETAANRCNYVNYHHDEANNAAGAGKCASDCDCDGMRDCKGGVCSGVARPPIACNHVDYHWNEAWNTQGAGRCANDCECDGLRSCASGACQGEARPAAPRSNPQTANALR